MKIVPIPARNPNSKPNSRFVDSLKIGVDRLWNGRKGKNSDGAYTFICNSLGGLATTCQQLEKLIESRMEGYPTFGQWVEQFGKFTPKQIQEARKAWMLDLIEEFSVPVEKPKTKLPPIPSRDPNSKPKRRYVRALKRGLKKLWDGRYDNYGEEFICHTLDDHELRGVIENRLSKNRHGATYEDWAQRFEKFTTEEIQAGRKAWMLDLIEEFSKRSD